jgi:hypothetical protein
MSQKTMTDNQWIAQCQPHKDEAWMFADCWFDLERAERYVAYQRATRRDVHAWRLVHRVTVTTVTEEVVE